MFPAFVFKRTRFSLHLGITEKSNKKAKITFTKKKNQKKIGLFRIRMSWNEFYIYNILNIINFRFIPHV